MGCFCAVPEEFYCEVLLLDESKLTLTTQQQGIKVSTARVAGAGVATWGSAALSQAVTGPARPPVENRGSSPRPQTAGGVGVCRTALTWSCLEK